VAEELLDVALVAVLGAPVADGVAEPHRLGERLDGAGRGVPVLEAQLLQAPVVDAAAVAHQVEQLVGQVEADAAQGQSRQARPIGRQRRGALPADGGHLAPGDDPVAGDVEHPAHVVVERERHGSHHVVLVDELEAGVEAGDLGHHRELQRPADGGDQLVAEHLAEPQHAQVDVGVVGGEVAHVALDLVEGPLDVGGGRAAGRGVLVEPDGVR
jgi:hypothetical protein